MINVLSYIGMNIHSEVCLWTLLGLIRTIFDATLFRVNANLKQVWQMSMPEELSMSVQRVLRTMISSVMLVQCFTVYVYLASYIVLLYPVFLEERPILVLPWLLLAAVRQLLCELTSLALGLGTCVLLGPARPPCIKFVIIKLISIMPAFYMWMLLYSYYHALKVASAFKTFPAVLPAGDQDYGLELAIRRRRTKSLLGEEQLRSKLVASLYGDAQSERVARNISKIGISSRMMHSTDTSALDIPKEEPEALRPQSLISHRMSETGSHEDWFGSEVVLPRASDRILEQFVLMLLRIGAYLDREGLQTISSYHILNNTSSHHTLIKSDNMNCPNISADEPDTPHLVGSSKENTALYLREYPQIFMKKSIDVPQSDSQVGAKDIQICQESEENFIVTKTRKHSVKGSSKETVFLDVEEVVCRRKYMPVSRINQRRPSRSAQSTSKFKQIKGYSKELKLIHKDIETIDNSNSGNQSKENHDKNVQNNEIILGTENENNCVPEQSKDTEDKHIKYETKKTLSSPILNIIKEYTSTTSEKQNDGEIKDTK